MCLILDTSSMSVWVTVALLATSPCMDEAGSPPPHACFPPPAFTPPSPPDAIRTIRLYARIPCPLSVFDQFFLARPRASYLFRTLPLSRHFPPLVSLWPLRSRADESRTKTTTHICDTTHIPCTHPPTHPPAPHSTDNRHRPMVQETTASRRACCAGQIVGADVKGYLPQSHPKTT